MNKTLHILSILLLLLGAAPLHAQTIKGNVYGGGEMAKVEGSTNVTINAGSLGADIFGGGEGKLNNDGTVSMSADVSGNTNVTINGGKFQVEQYTAADATANANPAEGMLKQNYNVYGGGNLACIVGTLDNGGKLVENTGNTTVTLNAAMLPVSFFKAENSTSQYRKWGETYAQHHDDKAIQGSVFGAGYGKNTQVLGNTTVDINIGDPTATLADETAIQGLFALAKRGSDPTGAQLASKFVITALGGGYDGIVSGDTKVTIQGSPMLQNVFGGGLGSKSGAAGNPTSEVGTVYGGSYVDILGGTIYGDVFGGGAGISGEVKVEDKDLPYYKAGWVCRETAVKIGKDGKDIQGITIFGNIYGGGDIANTGWYTEAVKPLETFSNSDMNLTNALVATSIHLNAGNVLGDVFGGGNGRASWYDGYTGADFRTHRPDIIGSMCGSSLVQVDGATVWGDIYGGGKTGRILTPAASLALNNNNEGSARIDEGSAYIYIKSGKVGKSIYGGGLGDIANSGNTVTAADVLGNTIVFFEDASLTSTKYWDNATGSFLPQDNEGAARGTATDVLHNLYGGGNLACSIGTAEAGVLKYGGDTRVLMKGSPSVANLAALKDNAYFQRASNDVGLPHFSAFGGGYGTKAVVLGNAKVDVELVNGSGFFEAIGGGLNGPIMGSTTVNINTNNKPIHGVYGGGYYAKVHKGTTVNITNAQITEDVFGGGALGDIGKTDDTSITLNISGGTIAGSVYGANDVSGTVEGLVKVNITGGTIMKNVYGAGNGDHIGYYEPGRGHYDVGENDNYYEVDHSEETGPKGNTYKGRPQTPVGVEMYLAGATIKGQVFGGGNSCTVGEWETDLSSKYGGDPHKWRDDPDFFKGGGKVSIKLGGNVTIGQSNADVAEDYKNEDGENVSGLFMGNNGAHLATQSTAKDDYFYHHYYDKFTAKYWPGFAVYKDNGELMNRTEGLASFNAYLNNILLWTDNVSLSFDEGATNIRLANFVGGGFRGSMKAKTESKKFSYTLPASVTIGNAVVGGAYNTDVVYRIFATEENKHTYTEVDGHYQYLKSLDGLTKDTDYRAVEYGADGTTVKGIYRFVYDGGVLSSSDSTMEDFSTLILQCQFAGGEKARVFGGCFASGIIQGDAVVNYRATGAYDVYGGGALADVKGATKVNLLAGSLTNAYGGGLGRLADNVKDYAPVPALVNGNATTTLNGSVVNGSIFGANNINGTPQGHVKVHVLKTTPRAGQGAEDFDVPAVYGGGNLSAYEPTANDDYAEVLIENCDNSIAYVYGGGNAAPVPATQVTIKGANAIDNAFAGGNGAGQSTDPSAANYNPGADIGYKGFFSSGAATEYGTGIATINVQGGTIHHVYGGSNTLGYIKNHAEVNVNAAGTCTMDVAELYGGGKKAPGKAAQINITCTGEGKIDNVYGGAHMADLTGDIELNIRGGKIGNAFGGNNESGTINGAITVNVNWDTKACGTNSLNNVYGAGNKADYTGSPAVNILNGTVNENVFGGGLEATVTGNPVVTVDGGTVTLGAYGGGALANVDGTTTVNIISGAVGNAYGGGLGQLADAGAGKEAVAAIVTGDANVTASGGTTTNVFGCNNLNGSPEGNVTVTIKEAANVTNVYGGGNQAAASVSPVVNINGGTSDKVYGGGYGATAVLTGSPTVNVSGGTVSHDVYGGGALANVTGDPTVNVSGGTVSHDVYGGGALAHVTGNTVVNLTGGSINSAYGGGLGNATTSALVFGDATTTLNGSVVNGSIFGCNNLNGTPLGHVKVHVQKTMKRAIVDSDPVAYEEFDVAAVYGGGNQAAYVPTGSYEAENPGTSLTDNTKFAEVIIEGCGNSIEYVYGGGNAAPVPATDVTIYGGTISKAFAGGNGAGVGNKGADIGYLGFYSETGDSTPKFGAGTTKMIIYGGTIEDVYGGSNTLGYIRTSATVEVDKVPDGYDACPLNVTNVHGGGNNAPMYCNGSVTLNCTKGVDVIYGGAENADIHGNIELNITSGTYKQVFCGNNKGGNIDGSLKVNIDETGCWPIIIGELYGCGNNAAYSVYGYDADRNCVTSGNRKYDDPEVNVISCTSIGKVFGAGKGEGAAVYGNPTVNINTIKGAYAGDTVPEGFIILDGEVRREATTEAERTIPNEAGTIGTIYGGGNEGAVYGNTTVNIGTLATNKHLKDKDDDSVEPEEVAVTITGNVFGGGNEAIVSGDTKVTIGEDNNNE